MKYRSLGSFSSLLLAIILSGCASIYSGNHDTVHFSSVPQGAKVEINGVNMGVTPISLELKRSVPRREVKLSKEGYKSRTMILKRRLHPLVVIDALTIVGGLIDLATGSIAPYQKKYRFQEVELKSTTDQAKVDKKKFYNMEDNYYIIKFNKDTIYCEPDVTDELGRIYFTPIGGKRQSISNNEVAKFKRTNISSWALLALNKRKHFNQIYEGHPFWPEKKPDMYIYMQLCIQDTTYKLLSMYSASGVNRDGEWRTIGTDGMAYYIFKGDEFVAHLSRENYMEDLKQYFPGCKGFINYLEENNVKYKRLSEYVVKYKKEHDDAFYIKPSKDE